MYAKRIYFYGSVYVPMIRDMHIMANSYKKYKKYVELITVLYSDAHKILLSELSSYSSSHNMVDRPELNTYIRNINKSANN